MFLGGLKFYFDWEGPFELLGGPFVLLGGPFPGGLKIIKGRAVLFCWEGPFVFIAKSKQQNFT